MSGCFFLLGFVCYFIAFVTWLTEQRSSAYRQTVRREAGPIRRGPARPARRGPAVQSTSPTPIASGGPMRDKLRGIQVGDRIRVRHPVRGELSAHVDGAVVYAELMQQGRQAPWTSTGNLYPGFWLEGAMFLLNWQNRLYLLDESTQVSDAEIQRDFAPHARKFAQSDQTADVYFAYPPASWKIADIGKFRVEGVEGTGIRFRRGAIGRFIHAHGDSGRALVVEDYESGGGGEDTVWTGYQIEDADVKT